MWIKFKRFLKDEDGPTTVEYAIMLALIVVICLASIRSIGTSNIAIFENAAEAVGPPTP